MDTWRAIHREGFALLAALAIPAGCISVIEFIGQGYPRPLPFSLLYSLLFWLLAAPFFVLFAVVCHRSIILGGESLPNRLGLFWGERETRFFGWTVAIIIVTFLLSILVTLLALVSPFGPTITAISVAVFMSYIYVRIAMVLPATAVADGVNADRWRLTTGTSFDHAWSLTSGNGFRILFVIVLASAPVVIVGLALIYLFASSFFAFVLALVFRHAIPLVAICALSVSYRELIEAENAELPD